MRSSSSTRTLPLVRPTLHPSSPGTWPAFEARCDPRRRTKAVELGKGEHECDEAPKAFGPEPRTVGAVVRLKPLRDERVASRPVSQSMRVNPVRGAGHKRQRRPLGPGRQNDAMTAATREPPTRSVGVGWPTRSGPANSRRARPNPRTVQPGVLLVLLVLLLSGCRIPAASPANAEVAPTVDIWAAIESLVVVSRPPVDRSYRRAAFGRAWADTDHDGCSQRVNALARSVDRTQPFTMVHRGRCAADVVAGTWLDPYTGSSMTFTDVKDPEQAQQIPVDHVVALASAWRYGARHWTDERRLQFATDLDNLQPTSRAVNSAKSDRDAAGWRPKRPFQCAYASRYIAVKVEYGLPVDRSEKAALKQMLDNCGGQR